MPKSTAIIQSSDYKALIQALKTQVQSSQIKVAVSVNRELLKLYWFIGAQIVEKQKAANWGDGFIKQVSYDLQQKFPGMKGFSVSNLKYMKQWYLYWHQWVKKKSQQVVGQKDKAMVQQAVVPLDSAPIFQIPWDQNLVIISKSSSPEEALFYVQQTIENNWSRVVLTHQMESGLYQCQGKAMHNFTNTLPKPHSDLAAQTLKDPYCFDFLTMREAYDERDLKTGEFTPEFAGKLNFYVSAVDDLLASEQEQPTIGMLICKSSHKSIVEYALKDMHKPIGVSEYELTSQLPEQFKSSLPSIEEIEAELRANDA